ncbi:MAG: MerR family transcriptional regulator [Candidatus Accumulibacter sp. 66-26]|nr:MerR family DNA-binding transcriptional regulator [Accumulibacter sp.]OJW47456.1 MAG: MerR family transcriptional regulator [Candidatus Accumulibacter sp. 66-26]
MDRKPATFSISDLAREFGITPRTIRFYEDQGLLAPRREGLTRVFTRRDRTRLKLALRGKRLGFSLAEIRYLIEMYDTARDKNTQLTEFLNGLSQRKAALQQQREDIEAVLQEVSAFEQQCRDLLSAREAAAAPARAPSVEPPGRVKSAA